MLAVLRQGLDRPGFEPRWTLMSVTRIDEPVLASTADRLGLWFDLDESGRDPSAAGDAIRRQLAWEREPAAFAQDWQPAQEALLRSVREGRQRLTRVACGAGAELELQRLALHHGAPGLRPGLFAVRAACAHAALRGALEVGEVDVAFARARVLAPRGSNSETGGGSSSAPAAAATAAATATGSLTAERDRVHEPAPMIPALPMPEPTPGYAKKTGRRGTLVASPTGRGSRSRPAHGRRGRIDWVPTLRRAAAAGRPATGPLALTIRSEDLMLRDRQRRAGCLFVLVVDASGSMAKNRVREAKSAAIGLLRQA
jgi:magnesium chelatase subunit D